MKSDILFHSAAGPTPSLLTLGYSVVESWKPRVQLGGPQGSALFLE